ncbi:MAG: AMP-binding protein, partial [Gammaproteobacteria bacterium]|nr:AMP-binding protein [Gammaproteobacteria bacterium]
FEVLCGRHEQLRTTFGAADGQPFQRIAVSAAVVWRELDLSPGAGGAAWDEAQRQALSAADARVPFDLAAGPLWRVTWVRLGAEVHELWLTLHHLIGDGWSLQRLLDEFAVVYAAQTAGQAVAWPPVPVRYVDYAVWQRAWLEAGEGARQLDYWRAQLGDEPAPALLPVTVAESDAGGRVAFALPEALSAGVRERARAAGVTPFVVLLTAFEALLYRNSGVSDIRVGVPLANRHRAETESVFGYFVNTVVFRTAVHGSLTFDELLMRVRETALGAQAHPDLPFEQLVETLQPERSLERNPLFQVMYNHQVRDVRALESTTGLRVEPVVRDSGAAQFDLSLDTEDDGAGGLSGFFTYAVARLAGETVERLAGEYLALLGALVSDSSRRLGTVDLLVGAEWSALTEWNRGAWEGVGEGTSSVSEQIARWAVRQPDAVALVAGEERLSYGALEAASNRLAWWLRAAGVGPEVLVAVRLERSVELIIALLGVWKAGGAFVPIDPEAPAAELLARAGVGLGLTSGALPALEGADSGCRWLDLAEENLIVGLRCAHPTYDRGVGCGQGHPVIDEAGASEDTGPGSGGRYRLRAGARSRADREVFTACPGARSGTETVRHPDQLAYVIHTSGSTGVPKGVAVSHGALSRHVQAAAAAYGLRPGDGALHLAAFSFDAAVEQWTVPLISGARLVLSDTTLWSAEQLQGAVVEHRLTRLDVPPAYLAALAEAGVELPGVHCTVGGEALPQASLERILSRLQPASLTNAYGPTEAVITPLLWTADGPCSSAYAPLGRPLGPRTAWVLDGDLNPLPAGVAGELAIGGPLLARGYHGQPGLTAERFLPDPFGPPGTRLYRTGDRVRQRSDGVIDFLGRTDQQLKLRGYRIEPGEIEAALCAAAGVSEAVVVLREEDTAGAQLVGYVGGEGLTPERLQAALREQLPAYLVPQRIVVLERLPRLASGKLDRRALPAPERASPETLAPRTPTEAQLAAIWQEVLGLDSVGVSDNFFELGGDSILSLQVVSRARAVGYALSPKDLFRHQTLAALAAVARPLATTAFDPGPVTGAVPLTPIQAEFFATDIPARHHWNQSVLLASPGPLDTDALAAALRALLAQHDSLRLRYRQVDGAWQQAYAEAESAAELLWHRPVADRAALAAEAEAAQRSLDLAQGPVLRAVYMPVADGSARLLLVIHHLVVDGVSWRILLEDLHTAYRQRVAGQSIVLPPKTASFQTWARHLENYAASEALRQEAAFWAAMLTPPLPDPPRDVPVEIVCYRDADEVAISLDEAETRQLLRKAPAAYRSRIEELLLVPLAMTLCGWTRQREALIELERHGRMDRFDGLDLSRTVGWFTCLHPVRVTLADELAATIKMVKECLRAVPDDGAGYSLLRR